jgi:hypothetical protein
MIVRDGDRCCSFVRAIVVVLQQATQQGMGMILARPFTVLFSISIL